MTDTEERCDEMIRGSGPWGSLRKHRCTRKAVAGGKCRQHTPEAAKARQERGEAQREQAKRREIALAVARCRYLGYVVLTPEQVTKVRKDLFTLREYVRGGEEPVTRDEAKAVVLALSTLI